MAKHDWYRNTDWNETISSAFFEKLKRAKDKSQYIRVQACMLVKAHPNIALDLLERYFALGEHFDMAQAYVDRATAYLSLGNIDSAIASYEMAVERERVFPNVRTSASLDLPYLIAMNGLSDRYDQAFSMLSSPTDGLMFPVERFKYHAARAMILCSSDSAAAATEARLALESAALDHSGFRYHPKLGLVSEKHASTLAKLRGLCNA